MQSLYDNLDHEVGAYAVPRDDYVPNTTMKVVDLPQLTVRVLLNKGTFVDNELCPNTFGQFTCKTLCAKPYVLGGYTYYGATLQPDTIYIISCDSPPAESPWERVKIPTTFIRDAPFTYAIRRKGYVSPNIFIHYMFHHNSCPFKNVHPHIRDYNVYQHMKYDNNSENDSYIYSI